MRYWVVRKLFNYNARTLSYAVFKGDQRLKEEPVAEVRCLIQVYLENSRSSHSIFKKLSTEFKKLGTHWKGTNDNDYSDEKAIDHILELGEVAVLSACMLLQPRVKAQSREEKAVVAELIRENDLVGDEKLSYGLVTQLDPRERLKHKLPPGMIDRTPRWLDEQHYEWARQQRNVLKVLMASNSRVALSTLEGCAELPEYADLRLELEAAISRIKQQAS
jgi:hypothetical protein